MIGAPYLAGISAGIMILGFTIGYETHRLQSVDNKNKAIQAVQKKYDDLVQKNADLGLAYAMKKEEVVTRTITQIKEVPRYVTKEAVAKCTVPTGFVRVYNASALQEDTSPEPGIDDTPSQVGLDTIAQVSVTNNGTCNKYREQIIALQEYITEIQK